MKDSGHAKTRSMLVRCSCAPPAIRQVFAFCSPAWDRLRNGSVRNFNLTWTRIYWPGRNEFTRCGGRGHDLEKGFIFPARQVPYFANTRVAIFRISFSVKQSSKICKHKGCDSETLFSRGVRFRALEIRGTKFRDLRTRGIEFLCSGNTTVPRVSRK